MAENNRAAARRRNGRHVWRAILFTLIAIVVLAAFISRHKGEVPVRVDHVVRQDLVNSISTNGKVEPIDNFEAHAPAPTTARKILVHEGEHVHAGQLLMQLDDADARAQAAKATAALRTAQADQHAIQSGGTQEEVITTQADLIKARSDRDAAQRNYDTLQRLQKTGAAAPAELREAANRLAAADAQLKLLQQKQQQRYSDPEVARVQAEADEARASLLAAQNLLQHSDIRSPFEGTVYSIPVRQGEYVQQGELLLQMANLHKVQVRAFVDEPEIGKLSVGQPVSVTWDALPGKSWQGAITQVPYTVTTLGTRNVGQVLCAVENNDSRLLPNTNVTVNVSLARKGDVITVAREALHQDEKGHFVYVIKEGHLSRQPVDAGISNNTRTEIASGLRPGDVVALNTLNPAEVLRPGLAVSTPR
jgi:HlyD family secretion protein